MKRRLPLLAMLFCALGFLAGLAWLFQLRFAHGDVYPPYSTLRADPLGAMALFESLEALPGVTVRRDFSSDEKLPGIKAAYLHLAGDPEDWQEMPVDVVRRSKAFSHRAVGSSWHSNLTGAAYKDPR